MPRNHFSLYHPPGHCEFSVTKSGKSFAALMLCLMISTVGCETQRGQELGAALGYVSAQAATLASFYQWAKVKGIPYRDLTVEELDKGRTTYSLVKVKAKFIQGDKGWVEMTTYAECVNIGSQWQAPSDFVFSYIDLGRWRFLEPDTSYIPSDEVALLAFYEWAKKKGVPYRDVALEKQFDDDTFAVYRVTALFRETRDDQWTVKWADVELKKVGGEWQAPDSFSFDSRPTPTPTMRPTSVPTVAVTPSP